MTQPRKARPVVKAKPPTENAIDFKVLQRTLDRMAKEFAEEANKLQAQRIAREVAQEKREEWR